jgi:hypothetical protein
MLQVGATGLNHRQYISIRRDLHVQFLNTRANEEYGIVWDTSVRHEFLLQKTKFVSHTVLPTISEEANSRR